MSDTDHAIVVGIRRYPTLGGANPDVAMDLEAPDLDAEEVAEWLADPKGGGLDPGRIRRIRSADYPDPFDPGQGPRPVEDDIVKAFDAIYRAPRRRDGRVGRRFYLYVSGHGFGHDIGRGGLFTANANDLDRDHIFVASYFDWIVKAALFEQYVLWFDACSTRDPVDPPKPARFRRIVAPNADEGRRMVVYAARFFRKAIETDIDGRTRGVFTHTLLDGLRGGAVEPATGAVTTTSLRNYLINNMRRHMTPQQLSNPEISNEPDFAALDDFVLVPPPAAAPAAMAAAAPAPAPAAPAFRLTVAGEDPAAEVFVVDADNRLAARGLKGLRATLPAGRYTVRAMLGRGEWEAEVALDGDREVALPPIAFASPIPLPGTDRTHESHQAAADEARRATGEGPGEGASLMVMARWWTTDPARRPFPGPQAGLALHHHGEGEPVDLGQGAAEGDLGGDRWATRTLSVDPGLHRLALMADGRPAEMTLTALEGWQTRVFLLLEPAADAAQRGPRLADVSVVMWREGLAESPEALRLAEAVRIALADERSVLSRELLEAAEAGRGNPLMGLHALHHMLLLREKEDEEGRRPGAPPRARGPERPARFDAALFEGMLARAIDLFGEDHPDIRAIRLAAGQQAGRLPVATPPMLWRSWAALVRASNANPRLLPVGLWEHVAEQTLHRPFLIWLRPSDAALREGSKLRQVEEILGRLAAAPADAAGALAPREERGRLAIEMGVPRAVIDRALGAS